MNIKIEYLIELGADKVPHSGGTLLEHLIGVHDILSSNGAPQYVCDAGLYHSIYGTFVFKHQTTKDRDKVREVIGYDAERLVNEFCLLQNPRKYFIGELQDGDLRRYLTLLNDANYIEQSNRPTPEMSMEEAYGHIGFDSGRNI
mgnify:CR=1 FL=1